MNNVYIKLAWFFSICTVLPSISNASALTFCLGRGSLKSEDLIFQYKAICKTTYNNGEAKPNYYSDAIFTLFNASGDRKNKVAQEVISEMRNDGLHPRQMSLYQTPEMVALPPETVGRSKMVYKNTPINTSLNSKTLYRELVLLDNLNSGKDLALVSHRGELLSYSKGMSLRLDSVTFRPTLDNALHNENKIYFANEKTLLKNKFELATILSLDHAWPKFIKIYIRDSQDDN